MEEQFISTIVIAVKIIMNHMGMLNITILIRVNQLTHNLKFQAKQTLTISCLKKEHLMKSFINGLQQDGLLTEMTPYKMISPTDLLLTTGSSITLCKYRVTHFWLFIFRFQNGLFLKAARLLFDNSRSHNKGHHEGLGGVKIHENSLFLYKSKEADSLLRSRMMDYLFAGCLAGLVTG